MSRPLVILIAIVAVVLIALAALAALDRPAPVVHVERPLANDTAR